MRQQNLIEDNKVRERPVRAPWASRREGGGVERHARGQPVGVLARMEDQMRSVVSITADTMSVSRLQVLEVVGVRGFEPPTPSSRRKCATRLRYTPRRAEYQNPPYRPRLGWCQ